MQTERQQEILNVALELIHEKGIQGLTIKNLSRKIGISEPAIYRHYENKISILNAILDRMKKDYTDIFRSSIPSETGALEKIEHLFRSHYQSFMENPPLASAIFAEELFRNEKALTRKLEEVIAHNNEILMGIIEDGQADKSIRQDIPAGHLATMIIGTLRFQVKKWQLSDYRDNLAEEGQGIVHMISKLIARDTGSTLH